MLASDQRKQLESNIDQYVDAYVQCSKKRMKVAQKLLELYGTQDEAKATIGSELNWVAMLLDVDVFEKPLRRFTKVTVGDHRTLPPDPVGLINTFNEKVAKYKHWKEAEVGKIGDLDDKDLSTSILDAVNAMDGVRTTLRDCMIVVSALAPGVSVDRSPPNFPQA